MSAHGLVDWRLAERVAAGLASRGETRSAYTHDELLRTCDAALADVSAYIGLAPTGPVPAPELIDRAAWTRSALATLAAAVEPLERRMGGDLGLPGPLGGVARGLAAGGAGAEAGVVVGYAARKVLGQYDFPLFGEERPARLLFVAPNLQAAREELTAEPGLFLRWVALHECTHVLQFEAVPWLRMHVRSLAGEIIESVAAGVDVGALARSILRFVRSDPRRVIRSVARDGVHHLLATPPQRERLDRLQATMAAIEGHAEHVMDVCAAEEPGLKALRKRLEERRDRRGGVGGMIAKLLGLELKMRQYREGKAFFDAIARVGGAEAVGRVWTHPDALPTAAELVDPAAWLARAGGAPAPLSA